MIKLVLTDLDDTLIPYGAPHASERAIAAIHAMHDAGVVFGPMSGRKPSAMDWMFCQDELCYKTGAFANGQLIRLEGEVVHTQKLHREDLQQVADVVDGLQTDAWLSVYDIFASDGDHDITFVTRRQDAWRQHEGEHPSPSHDVVDHVERDSYLKANVQCLVERPQMVRIRDILRKEVPQLGFVFPSLIAPFIDISPAGWNKGSAVRFLADRMGIGIDEVVVFGDSENDLPMIEAVPNSVAMANADEAVSCAAGWHIGYANDDAVAAAFEDIAQASSRGEMPSFMHD